VVEVLCSVILVRRVIKIKVKRAVSVTGKEMIRRVYWADSFWLRLRGLIGRELGDDEALVLIPSKSVHSVGMAYALDLVYLDKDFRVIKIERGFKPFRLGKIAKEALAILELRAGMAKDISVNDKIIFLPE